MRLTLITILFICFSAHAQKTKKQVNYEYKKFERFDFDEIGVEGESGAPGDLSIAPNPRKNYGNRLPERKNFNKELRKSASGIR
jgi:hypothetical protein